MWLLLGPGLGLLCCGCLAVEIVRRRRKRCRDRLDEAASRTLVIVIDPADPQRLVLRRLRRATRLAATGLGDILDRQLAAGRPPETSLLLAARAQQVASPATCRKLARDWRNVIERTPHPTALFSPHAPICSERVRAAATEVQRMLADLNASGPKNARGVAMLRLLLSDGRGPLFDRRCEVDLATALRQAASQLDAAATMTRWA